MDDDLREERQPGDLADAALDAWTPLAPPAGFADRVLAARDAELASAPVRRRRWPFVAGALACTAAAAVAVLLVTRPPSRAATGSLDATARTTTELGDRAVAVVEPAASITWRIDDAGGAAVEQRAGTVFYRVDRGGPFVVHTPAGDVRVTGTCFRIEVEPMTSKTKLVLSGAAGAVLATAIVITVYEGVVVAETRDSRTELAAGTRATVGTDGRTTIAPAPSTAVARLDGGAKSDGAENDDAKATREELIARAGSQRTELAKLRARLAELEQHDGHADDAEEPGRAWYDPSEERLKAWAAQCHVRADIPDIERFQPAKSLGANSRGVEPGELTALNAAMAEVQAAYKQLVRGLYLEATGDTVGADTLSLEAMRKEIEAKGTPGEHGHLLQKIAAERAGLQPPPADLSKTSPFERQFRAYLQLGDQTEAAIAARLGKDRAKAIRGDGWGSRSNWSGCPEK